MSLLDTIKSHPIAAVAIVIVVGGGTLYALSSGGGSTQTTGATAYDSSGTALNDQMIAAQQQSANLSAELQASAAHDTTSIELAKIQLQAFNANEQTQQFKIENDTAVAMQASTLNAQVAQAGINANVQQQSIAANTSVSLAQTQAHSQEVLTNTLARIAGQQIQSTQAVATQSWWSKIFG